MTSRVRRTVSGRLLPDARPGTGHSAGARLNGETWPGATDCSIEYWPTMILDERSAAVFINGYRQLLLEISGPTGGDFKLLERLVEGRKKLMSDGSLLDGALSRIRSQARSVDEAVVAAAGSLQVNSWVYLRDTRRYSVFLDPAGKVGYGTLGITEPIKELVGGAGALIETGLLLFDGRIVCDGLISSLVWIGPSYRRSYNEALADIRSAANFYTDRLVSRSRPESGSCCG